jgi:hypothetical protein
MMRQLFLLFFACLSASSADWSISLTEVDPYVRSQVIWRARIIGDIPSEQFNDGPYLAQIALKQGNTRLLTQDYPLEKLGQLITGIRVAVAVPLALSTQPSEPIQVQVNVSDPLRRIIRFANTTVHTPLFVQRQLEAVHAQFLQQFPIAHERPPLPSLWFEQAGELLSGSASEHTCDQLHEILRCVQAHNAGQPLTSTLYALRDRIDHSVQPYRLHVPSINQKSDITALAVIFNSPTPSPRKSNWPQLPPAWIHAALQERCAVLEIYPAGDVNWGAFTRQRARCVIDHVQRQHQLDNTPIILCGIERGANGALGMIEDDPAFSAGLALHNPLIPEPKLSANTAPSEWLSYMAVGMRPAHVAGTTIMISGTPTELKPWWLERLRLTTTPVETSNSAPGQPDYWRAVKKLRREKSPSQWIVTKPGIYGPITVTEMTQWGVVGTITSANDKTFHCTGINEILTPPKNMSVTGARVVREAKRNTLKKIYPNALGPCSDYISAPFVVVVGTDESVAAQQDNRALAAAFVQAWESFTHGTPLVIDDQQFSPKLYADYHVICMGNTRSHRVLKQWFADDQRFPLEWDARSVRFRANNSTQTFLRAEKRPVVMAWPQAKNPARLVIVCDGRPAWMNNGQPFAELSDCAIGGLLPSDPPVVWRTFSNLWE